ncbi:ribbon-helix-helix domain-containing protein [Azospirillum sp.]|uniref:ribbon-helix-helix domain-containing protein n=1 Tax=Azospirillum sp. TaxID=34012 RepID=UPI002D5981EB|nr:ribbon-helix-helix domain-containing protein [Azospirillum sp.]HYD65099.1 ribbon-helix-helix domain-containing protein [Azospirillum sp.]
MAKRGPKTKRKTEQTSVVSGLQSRNIMVGGHRTSMRLEPSMWDALDDIAKREGLTVHELCTRIKERIEQQAKLRDDADEDKVTLTSAVRVLIAMYYRRASTDEGHSRAGHGEGDPFAGTPFAVSPREDGDPPTDEGGEPPGGEGPGFSGPGKPPGVSGKPQAAPAHLDA